mmetsp:Transcript_5846/g.12402  ORF Transcript_5846/g.12402 Transcript_5846/m.12402 type:complete len:213 (-) Transcript_5846:380-1018(-)
MLSVSNTTGTKSGPQQYPSISIAYFSIDLAHEFCALHSCTHSFIVSQLHSMMAFLKSTLRFVYLFQSAQSFVHNVIRLPDDSRISVSLSASNEDGRVVSFLLDSNHHRDDWHRYCENVDKNLEGLVSPSPESFSAIHRGISRSILQQSRLSELKRRLLCVYENTTPSSSISLLISKNAFLVVPPLRLYKALHHPLAQNIPRVARSALHLSKP